MVDDPYDRLVSALNALKHLQQAQKKFNPEQNNEVEQAKEYVRQEKYQDAKVVIIDLLQSQEKNEELWIALIDVLCVLGETDIEKLIEYIQSGQQ